MDSTHYRQAKLQSDNWSRHRHEKADTVKTQISLFEVAVADALAKRGWDVFAAVKDRGVDLVAFPSLEDGGDAVRIQVKGSRTYAYEPRFQGFFTLKLGQVASSLTDVWVFVCLVPTEKGKLEHQFVAIPRAELLRRLESYGDDRNGRVIFYLTEHADRLVDDRGLPRVKVAAGEVQIAPERDYTDFWGLDEFLSGEAR